MAVAFEGFSIREYALRMRSVDVGKCCPFSGDLEETKKEDAEALLPPITVTKFRWWSQELELARSNPGNEDNSENLGNEKLEEEKLLEETAEMVCPVCGIFKATTVNAVNAHVDGCLAHASREQRRQMRMGIKGKSKARKKRSIVEIFAVAPQIEAGDVEETGSDEEDELDNCKSLNMNQIVSNIKTKMNKKNKCVLEEDNVVFVKKLTKKKKKKMKKNGAITKKEKTQKLKLQRTDKLTSKLDGSLCNKRLAKDILDVVSTRIKKRSLKCLSTQKKHKVAQSSKVIPKHQKSAFPVRSILKTHTKVVSGKMSAICNKQAGSNMNSCSIQHPSRHVRFSGKDDILGLGRKKYSFECPKLRQGGNLFSEAFASSSEKDQSTESDKELADMEVDGSDEDVSTSTENGIEVQPTVKKKLLPDICDHADIPNFLRPHVSHQEKVRHLPDKSVYPIKVTTDDNLMFWQGQATSSLKPSYAGIPKILSASNEGHDPVATTHVGVGVPRASNYSEKLINHSADPTHKVPAMSSMENIRMFPRPSSVFTLNENVNGRLPILTQSPAEDTNSQGLRYRPVCHMSPTELIGGLYSFPEWNEREFMSRGNCLNDEFFGLPLNSQGELIQLSSISKGALNQPKKPNFMAGSSSSLPGHNLVLPRSTGDFLSVNEKHCVNRDIQNEQLNFFPAQNFVKENPNMHLPARLGLTETEEIGRADSERVCNTSFGLLNSNLNLINASCHGCGQFDQIQRQRRNGMILWQENSDDKSLNNRQPTMRLMGKDVAVGRSSKDVQRFEDGKVWTDKEIVAEHCPAFTALNDPSLRRRFQQDWVSHPALGKEIVGHSLDIQRNQTSQSNLLMKAPESRFFHPHLNWQTNVVFQNSQLTVNGNPSSELHPFAHPPSFPALFNTAPNLQECLISAAEPVYVSSQLPVSSSPFKPQMGLGPAELQCRQNLPPATKSIFDFPFLHPDCKEHGQPSCFQSSSNCLPPWLLNAAQQKSTSTIPSSKLFSDVNVKHHPCTTSVTEFLTTSSLYHSPAVSYNRNPMTSNYHSKSSPVPQSPLLPVFPLIKPTSAINMGYRNRIKAKDRIKSKAFGVKNPYLCSKTKKRPAGSTGDSKKQAKKLNLELQGDLSALTEMRQERFATEMRCNAGAVVLNSNRDKASSAQCGPNETRKDGLGASPDIDFSNVDVIARSGPVKLSAGVKHILKPSQNMDQDNPRPIHSTIPFASVTNSGRLPSPRNKDF